MVSVIQNLVSIPTCTEVLASTVEHHSPALTVPRKILKAVQELPAERWTQDKSIACGQ